MKNYTIVFENIATFDIDICADTLDEATQKALEALNKNNDSYLTGWSGFEVTEVYEEET